MVETTSVGVLTERTAVFADAWQAQIEEARSSIAVRALLLSAGRIWLTYAACERFQLDSDADSGRAYQYVPESSKRPRLEEAEACAEGTGQTSSGVLLRTAPIRQSDRLSQPESEVLDRLDGQSSDIQRAASAMGSMTQAAWAALVASDRFALVAECLLTGEILEVLRLILLKNTYTKTLCIRIVHQEHVALVSRLAAGAKG